LSKAAEGMFDKAEQFGQIKFVTWGNSMRRSIKDKEYELQSVEKELQDKVAQMLR
jgi:hypothetical protein